MNPLKTSQRVLAWLCICPFDESANKRTKIIIFALSIFAANLCSVAASVAFFFTFVSINLEESLYSILQIAAYFYVTYAMIMTFISRRKFNTIFEKLSKIFDTSKNPFKIPNMFIVSQDQNYE